VTDSNNDLAITGDASDSVQLVDGAGTWSGSVNGGDTDYTHSSDGSVLIKIDTDINVSII